MYIGCIYTVIEVETYVFLTLSGNLFVNKWSSIHIVDLGKRGFAVTLRLCIATAAVIFSHELLPSSSSQFQLKRVHCWTHAFPSIVKVTGSVVLASSGFLHLPEPFIILNKNMGFILIFNNMGTHTLTNLVLIRPLIGINFGTY